MNTSTSGSFAAQCSSNLRGHTSIVLSGAGKTVCFFKNGSWNILANTGTTA